MGMLAKALSAPSAYAVKRDQPELWVTLIDRVNGALFVAQLVELEIWMDLRPLDMPEGWYDELREAIDRKRVELREEDIGNILFDRYDFRV
jgi:hypothetical protein